MKRIALLSSGIYGPMSYIRFVGPTFHLGIELVSLNDKTLSECLEAASISDVVIVQREAAKHPYAFKLREYTRKQAIPFLFDLDDLLFFLPKLHPDRLSHFFTEALLSMLRMVIEADAVTVCSNHLKQTIEQINPQVYVVPNYIDDSLWHIRPPAECSGKVNILYFGTPSHKTDLASIQPALTFVLSKLSHSVSMTVMGIAPDELLLPLSSLQNVKFAPQFEHDYRAFVAKANTLEAHIGIAPLEANNFNMSKSYIKFLEYSCMGVAGIYSNTLPYTEQISSGIDGLLVSTIDEWVDALITLAQDDHLRRQIVMSAQSKLQGFLLSNSAQKWLSQLMTAVESSHGEKHSYSRQQLSDILKVLDELSSEYFLELKRQRESAEATAEYERRRKEELEEEVISYATSWSWKITRPLRWLGKQISALLDSPKGAKEGFN